MKQLKPNSAALPGGSGGNVPSLADLRALRRAQKDTNKRVEELKAKLFQYTDQHMDRIVMTVRRWLSEEKA